jgi:hypothetical protein
MLNLVDLNFIVYAHKWIIQRENDLMIHLYTIIVSAFKLIGLNFFRYILEYEEKIPEFDFDVKNFLFFRLFFRWH